MTNQRSTFSKVIIYLVLISGVLITLFPFMWMVLTSLKTRGESIQIPPTFFPEEPQFTNYQEVFDAVPFAMMYRNTIITAAVIVFFQVLLSSMAAYAFGRINFPAKNFIFTLLLAVLMIPGSFFILPQYTIVMNLGLLNTIPALFLPHLFSAFNTFLLRQFYMSVPDELEDAAKLDGCSHFRIYWQIMTPLVSSGLVAVAILALRYAWNDLMWPMIVNNTPGKMTLASGLQYLQGQHSTNYPLLMAGSVMAVLPLIIFYAIFQQQFIEGVAMSGLKA